jgi:WD40 repeat protein
LAVGRSEPLTVWDIPTKRLLLKLPGQRSSLSPLAWSPDRKLLAAETGDGSIAIWNIPQIRAQLADIGLDWE